MRTAASVSSPLLETLASLRDANGRDGGVFWVNWQRFNQLMVVYPLPKPVIHQSWYSVAAGPPVTFQKSPVR